MSRTQQLVILVCIAFGTGCASQWSTSIAASSTEGPSPDWIMPFEQDSGGRLGVETPSESVPAPELNAEVELTPAMSWETVASSSSTTALQTSNSEPCQPAEAAVQDTRPAETAQQPVLTTAVSTETATVSSDATVSTETTVDGSTAMAVETELETASATAQDVLFDLETTANRNWSMISLGVGSSR